MFRRKPKLRQLVFEITPPVSQRVRQWQIALTQRMLEHILAEKGRVQIVHLDGSRTASIIEALPEPGSVELFVGGIGGSYSYRFRVGRDQLSLIVSCNLQKSMFFPTSLPPLVVTVPRPVQLRHPATLPEALALHPFVASEPDIEFISELGATFFIDGRPLERLMETRWRPSLLTSFEYTFTPTQVGCRIIARDIDRGQDHDLTRGLRNG